MFEVIFLFKVVLIFYSVSGTYMQNFIPLHDEVLIYLLHSYQVSHKKVFILVFVRPLVLLRKSSVLEMNLWISSFKKQNQNFQSRGQKVPKSVKRSIGQ